jgi:hypothetical protein
MGRRMTVFLTTGKNSRVFLAIYSFRSGFLPFAAPGRKPISALRGALQKHLGKARSVVLSPDGVLNLVPVVGFWTSLLLAFLAALSSHHLGTAALDRPAVYPERYAWEAFCAGLLLGAIALARIARRRRAIS